MVILSDIFSHARNNDHLQTAVTVLPGIDGAPQNAHYRSTFERTTRGWVIGGVWRESDLGVSQVAYALVLGAWCPVHIH